MIEVSATDFCHQRGAFLDQAYRGGVVLIKRHQRPTVVMLSYDEYIKLVPQKQISTLDEEREAFLAKIRKQLRAGHDTSYSLVDEFLAEKRQEAELE